MNGLKSLASSRKFWVTMVAVAVPVLNRKFGWNLSEEQLLGVVVPLMGLVLGIAIEDHGTKSAGPAK